MLWVVIPIDLFYHKLKVDSACGDITDVASKKGVFVSDSQCNTACEGDITHSCGGLSLLNVYYWSQKKTRVTPGISGRYEANTLIFYLF